MPRNYNCDDAQNRDWIKLLLRLQGKELGEKYGRFVTIDDRVVFIGGPGSGAGGTSAGSTSGKLEAAKYDMHRKDAASLDDAERFIEDGLISIEGKSIRQVSNGERGRIKDQIGSELSNDTGIDYDTVNSVIRQWSETSNDSDPNSLAVQQEASKMFGSPLSSWQQAQIADFEKNGGMAYINGSLVDLPAGPVEPTMASRAQIRSILNAMYENTQTRLAEAGFPEYITLRRGVSQVSMPIGTKQNVYTNTLSSFTSSTGITPLFSYGGVVIEMQIPRSRILSTARTGLGCLAEAEFVIIGNNTGAGDEVYVG